MQGPLPPPLHRPLARRTQSERRRREVSATSKTELLAKLDDLREETDQGVRSSRNYTVAKAVDDWLEGPMADRAPKTITTQREILEPLTDLIGQIVLRDLQAEDVSKALIKIAATRSTRTVRDTRASLVRVVTYAQARGMVSRNVVSLIKAPQGKAPGRPSKALTVTQALAVLRAAEDDRIRAYFVLSLLTGLRTEEARALRWDHVGEDRTPFVAVWRSVRAGGDVKTRTVQARSGAASTGRRRTDSAPGGSDKERALAAELWQENGLVFTTQLGKPLDAANVHRSFRRICKDAGNPVPTIDHKPKQRRNAEVEVVPDGRVDSPAVRAARQQLDYSGVPNSARRDRVAPRWLPANLGQRMTRASSRGT